MTDIDKVQLKPEPAFCAHTEILEDEPNAEVFIQIIQFECTGAEAPNEVPCESSTSLVGPQVGRFLSRRSVLLVSLTAALARKRR